MNTPLINRRKNVILRLEEQLKNGKKNTRDTSSVAYKSIEVDLTDADKKRIIKELEILKKNVS